MGQLNINTIMSHKILKMLKPLFINYCTVYFKNSIVHNNIFFSERGEGHYTIDLIVFFNQ